MVGLGRLPAAPQRPPFLGRGPGSQSPTGGSLREGKGPRRGLRGPEERGPVACCWVQFGFGPRERGRPLCGLSGLSPTGLGQQRPAAPGAARWFDALPPPSEMGAQPSGATVRLVALSSRGATSFRGGFLGKTLARKSGFPREGSRNATRPTRWRASSLSGPRAPPPGPAACGCPGCWRPPR